MFRESLEYRENITRIKNALVGVGCKKIYGLKAMDLVGKMKVDGLEELMLATFVMMKFLMKYLKFIECDYEGGFKIGDLHLAIENLVDYVEPEHTNKHFLTHEAQAMERVSRSAYAWMKCFRLLKNQKITAFDASRDWEDYDEG